MIHLPKLLLLPLFLWLNPSQFSKNSATQQPVTDPPLSPPKKLAIRFAIYFALIVYLIIDLFIWKGPVRDATLGPQLDSEEAIAEAKAMGIVARVYFQPIYRAQVETRIEEHLWKRGRSLEQTTKPERRLLREVAAEQLIDELLMKVQIKISPANEYPIPEADQKRFFEQFKKRYPTSDDFAALMESQGWKGAEDEVQMRLNGRLEREVYLTSYIDSSVENEDVQKWYNEHQKSYLAPERRHVQQIFISSHQHDPEAAKTLIQKAHQRVTGGKEDFQKIAASIQESTLPPTPTWVTSNRIPEDVSLAIFAATEKSPFIFESKLGWHLAEVLAIEKETLAPFEEVQESIRVAIKEDRKKAAFHYFHRLMRLRAQGKIEIFDDILYIEDLE